MTKDIAIKTLKEDIDEDSKIRFLQEVAIMGQFSHPNVVKLHGLVSSDKPVCNRPPCVYGKGRHLYYSL